jgi:RHS repeat-associated protein
MSLNHGFTGEPTDANGLVYLRNRYYNPELGTFMSMDPYEGDSNEPMSLNEYAYAHGNPVNNTDPSGMVVCSDLEPTAAQRGECFRKLFDLSQNFGITLTEEESLSPRTKENWTSARVNNVYAAVQAINAKLGGNTRRAIGDTELRLLAQGSGREAAVTTRCDLLSLYLNFVGASDHVHSVDNLIHEFGHIVTLSPPVGRTTNSEALGPANEMENRPVALWPQIQNYRGFGVEDGWDVRQRESESSDPAEVVPDMFLYWVQGYGFPPDEDHQGQARSTFVNGGNIPGRDGNPLPRINDNTPINDGSIISSAGVQSWAANASCPSSGGVEVQEASFNNHPELMVAKIANNGWCSF